MMKKLPFALRFILKGLLFLLIFALILTALTLIGVMLIVIGACPPLRRSLQKKFFI